MAVHFCGGDGVYFCLWQGVQQRGIFLSLAGCPATGYISGLCLWQGVQRLTNGKLVNCVCEASGSDEMISAMFNLVRPGGHIVMIGGPQKPLHIENPQEKLSKTFVH